MAACEATRTARATRALGAGNVAGLAGLALVAAAVGCAQPGLAQTPAASTDNTLLAPSLEGAPAAPPPFRRPGEAAPRPQFVAPSRVGATPIYGSPSGFGVGDTGFDSSNTPHSKRKKTLAQAQAPGGAETTFAPVPTYTPAAPSKPPPPKKPPPPAIYPKPAATRPGATLPPPSEPLPLSNPPPEVHPLAAAYRPGASMPVPPPEYFDYAASTAPPTLPPPNTVLPGAAPQRPLPLAAPDPYAALGIRAGSFLLLPSLDLGGGYSTNPGRMPGAPAAAYFVAAPELKVASDWERHSFTADIAGSYTQYGASLIPALNVPFLNAKFDGRVDVTRDTQILLEQRFIVSSDNPGSPNLQAELARLPPNFDVGETLGVAQTFNRLTLSLKGTFDRATYEPSDLTNGQSTTNADRNFDQYAGIFRVGYELDPGLKPFVEVQEDERIHDEQFDRSGLERSSTGTTVKFGSAVDLFGQLTGEMAVGYVDRRYQDPTLPNVTGVIADGTLIWQASALTSAKLSASSQVYETVLAGAAGELSRDINLEIDHAFRAWLVGALKFGFGTDDYVGLPLADNRYFASVALTYKFTRELQLRAELRQDWQIATEPGFTYNATTLLLGLRLQR